MRGIESQGMLLAASSKGKTVLIKPKSNADAGLRVVFEK